MASRTEAQRAIERGLVRVGTTTQPKPATMVAPGDPVHLVAEPEPFVGRGGRKLAAALDRFPVEVAGRHAIDVGASTGGFTDCLLQRGIASVVALDVGYGQLHWSLRVDERVTVIERVNIRTADPGALGAPFDLVVADLSFISLRLLAPVFLELGHDDADWVVLVKPQFEAGRASVGRKGVVHDPEVRRSAIVGVVDSFRKAGLGIQDLATSPITGSSGNVEYLAWFRIGGGIDDLDQLFASAGDPA